MAENKFGNGGLFHPTYTWRIIPVSKWLITMVIVSPLSGATFPFEMAELHGL